MGFVHDAASARDATVVNLLLLSVNAVLDDHIRKAEDGHYGGADGRELAWDLAAAKARLQKVWELVNGTR